MLASRGLERIPGVLLILAVALVAAPDSPAGDGDPSARFRKAFRPLNIRKPGSLRKEIESSLPPGIVVESGPFDALVSRLLGPRKPVLTARDEACGSVHSVSTDRARTLLRTAARTLARERKALARAVAAIEAEYDAVYHQGYMEASEDARRTRKLAAVLVPFYRTLQVRQDGLRARWSPCRVGPGGGPRTLTCSWPLTAT